MSTEAPPAPNFPCDGSHQACSDAEVQVMLAAREETSDGAAADAASLATCPLNFHHQMLHLCDSSAYKQSRR